MQRNRQNHEIAVMEAKNKQAREENDQANKNAILIRQHEALERERITKEELSRKREESLELQRALILERKQTLQNKRESDILDAKEYNRTEKLQAREDLREDRRYVEEQNNNDFNR